MAVATTTMNHHTDPNSPLNAQNPNDFSSPITTYSLQQMPQMSTPEQQSQTATVTTPMFSQQEVLRFIQAAVLATQRQQQRAGASSASQPPPQQPNISMLPEERIMKPRVHMYASLYDMATHKPCAKNTSSNRGTMVTTLELPGLHKSDISISARPNGELVVYGERRPQHYTYLANMMGIEPEEAMADPGRTVFNELKFGRFQRIFKLPDGLNPSEITASMEDGMLVISWPIPAVGSFQQQQHQSEQTSSPVGDQQVAVAGSS